MSAVSDLTESHLALARVTDALFCSELETGDTPTTCQLATAFRAALKAYRNWNGCTRAVAAAFTANSQEAERREAWCRRLAAEVLEAVDDELDVEILN